ncbi:ATP-binding protein [Neorhizobium galegae]|uniref:AAA family ATPase n=1 Tax=Neorhizobium galegae TaxID=399 RepID=UPI00210584BE|nr:ATP-binding protein [Neorhizobium galegae]MCQ1764726.1 ATP-binding protein [Neorhizobium galegae]MCQ1849297.1 ATP-binding protein [Neorhizobium galegae]
MLNKLQLNNVGPSPSMSLDLSSRLNLITGDNGLGKSFLLDVAWWALTRKWPHELNPDLTSGYVARPTDVKKPATISFNVESKTRAVEYTSQFSPKDGGWIGKAGRPWNPGLVIYALGDGGFAVWDPARNYWTKKGNIDVQERLPAFVFSQSDVWNGRRESINGRETQISNGLIADWASWIKENGADARRMANVIRALTPEASDDHIAPCREFGKLSADDVREIPMLRMGYGQDVPILFASLGVRRIVALAYMLSWAWREHTRASEYIGDQPSTRIVMIFDELEAHLHPRWQRLIVPALLTVTAALTDDNKATIQLLAATHSPLVMASVEPLFDPKQDSWFDLDFIDRSVVIEKRPFVRRGDVASWLRSEAFDLGEARSLDSEIAITKAKALARQDSPSSAEIDEVEEALKASLGETDRFWARWTQFRETIGASKGK